MTAKRFDIEPPEEHDYPSMVDSSEALRCYVIQYSSKPIQLWDWDKKKFIRSISLKIGRVNFRGLLECRI